MGQLFFKKPLQTAIREGRKRTTIRRWDRPRLRAGQEAFAPGLGWLAIERVEPIELHCLADADARADGFDSLGDLTLVLHAMYPDHDFDGKQWLRVCFTMTRAVEASKKSRSAKDAHPTLWP